MIFSAIESQGQDWLRLCISDMPRFFICKRLSSQALTTLNSELNTGLQLSLSKLHLVTCQKHLSLILAKFYWICSLPALSHTISISCSKPSTKLMSTCVYSSVEFNGWNSGFPPARRLQIFSYKFTLPSEFIYLHIYPSSTHCIQV